VLDRCSAVIDFGAVLAIFDDYLQTGIGTIFSPLRSSDLRLLDRIGAGDNCLG
jgi:hypothetical protein